MVTAEAEAMEAVLGENRVTSVIRREMDKKLKICFLTATKSNYSGDIDSDVINDIGTDCFLAKPVNTIDLMNRLNILLSQE
jgi:DNA-binding response OmpR family regulator